MTINKAMVVHTFNPRTWEAEEGESSKTVRATQRFPCCKKTVILLLKRAINLGIQIPCCLGFCKLSSCTYKGWGI